MRISRQDAFTLIELLVVILILGILVAVAAPSFLGQTDKAHDSAAKQNLAVAYKNAKAESVASAAQGEWPSTAALIAKLNSNEPQLSLEATPVNNIATDLAPGNMGVCSSSTETYLELAVRSESGEVWYLHSESNGRQSVDQIPACGGTLTSSSTISTVAGSTAPGSPPAGYADGVQATSGPVLNSAYGVAAGRGGAFYIADKDNHRVRLVSPAGVISTYAGTGTSGFSGDGGQAASAQIQSPHGLVVGRDGTLYFSDGSNRVRKVSRSGIISTVAGNGTAGFSGDGGPATAAQLNTPENLAVTADGSLYIADAVNHRVRKVSPAGVITTVVGTGMARVTPFQGDGGPATAAELNRPYGLTALEDGTLYIAEFFNPHIRKVTPAGIISTVAGTGTAGFSGDGGLATAAQFNQPKGVQVAADGTIYVDDFQNHRVRKIDPAGVITTFTGSTMGYSGDGGPASAAQIQFPNAIALGFDGSLYIAGNNRVRKVAATHQP